MLLGQKQVSAWATRLSSIPLRCATHVADSPAALPWIPFHVSEPGAAARAGALGRRPAAGHRSGLHTQCPDPSLPPLRVRQTFAGKETVTWQALRQGESSGRDDAPGEPGQHAFVNLSPAPSRSERWRGAARTLPADALATFLPSGYPASVKPGYLSYVKYCTVGMAAGSAGGVLSMQALLHAVGLGSGAIPMAAALNWVIKDGLGQLGGVLFAATVNTKFDSDPKRWRMVSGAALDAACLLELLAPAAPALFIPLAATANVGKNVSWLAASASRAAIHQSFALRSNLADVTAKAGSQSIAASLVGTTLGVWLASLLGESWGLHHVGAFCVLSATHLGCTYMSLCHVQLATFNSQRLAVALDHYLRPPPPGPCRPAAAPPPLLTPAEVAARERFVPAVREAFAGRGLGEWLVVGPELPRLAPSAAALAEVRAALPAGAPYLLSAYTAGGRGAGAAGSGGEPPPSPARRACIMLLMRQGASVLETLQAVMHARLVRQHLEGESAGGQTGQTEEQQLTYITGGGDGGGAGLGPGECKQWRLDAVSDTAHRAQAAAREFAEAAGRCGWRMEALHAGLDESAFATHPDSAPRADHAAAPGP